MRGDGHRAAHDIEEPSDRVFDVAKYGIIGDGKVLDSLAIQRAIDEAAAYGKGFRSWCGAGKISDRNAGVEGQDRFSSGAGCGSARSNRAKQIAG